MATELLRDVYERMGIVLCVKDLSRDFKLREAID